MKLRLILMLLLSLSLIACGSSQPAASTTEPVKVPATPQPTSMPPTQPPPTAVPPTDTAAPAPTKPPVVPTNTSAPQPTETAVAAPAATKPRSTPTSAGPLSAAIYVANCRSAPTSEKPGRIVVQISVEAGGGNGRYRYFYQDKESPTKFIEVIGEKGTRIIGEVKVTSGDGQEIKKEFDIAASELTCP
jgi:hypothetical protein